MGRAHVKLLRIQKAMLEGIKKAIREYIGPEPPEVLEYYRAYKAEFARYQRVSSKQELIEEVIGSDIVYSADYHAFAQSQRTVLRILRELVPNHGNKIIIGMEAFCSAYQEHIDRYISGETSEAEFLEKTKYSQNWGFRWNNYKIIIDFAKDNGMHIIGLNLASDGKKRHSLEERDEHAADLIAECCLNNPGCKVYVIFGDLHMARCHLPGRVENRLRSTGLKRRSVIIYQNSESLYWKMAKRRVEQEVDVVRLGRGRYCILNSAPWVKLQAYLNWVENVEELSYGGKEFQSDMQEVDYSDQLCSLIRTLAGFFDIEPTELEDFSIYFPGEVNFLEALESSGKTSRKNSIFYQKLVQENRSFFMHGENIFYLASLSINHAASLAGVYLHSKCSNLDESYINPKRHFYKMVFQEMIGFLSSKVINHHRKCDLEQDFKNFQGETKYSEPAGNLQKHKEVVPLLLEHKYKEEVYLKNGRLPKFDYPRETRKKTLREMARMLGHIQGSRIFYGMLDGIFTSEEMQEMFFLEVEKKDSARRFYFETVKRLYKHKERYKSKNERL